MSEDLTETDEGPPRPTWRPLIPIYVGVTLFAVGEQSLHVLVSPYLSERMGQGTASIGAVVAVFGIASLLSRLPVGAVYRFDRALAMLLAGGVLCTLAFACVPLVVHPLPFAGLMALDGMGWSLVTTTQLALLVATRPAGLPTAGAMAWYSGSQGLGNTLGGVSAGFLADNLGFTGAFVVLAAVPAVATVVQVVALRRAPSRVVGRPDPMGRPTGIAAIGRSVRSMPLAVWAAVLVMFYINFMSGLLNTLHPVLALAAGLSLTQIGTLATCRSFASSSIRLASGPLFSRGGGTRRMTLPLTVLSATAVFLIPAVRTSFVLQVPMFLAVGFARGLLRITASTDALDAVGDDEREHGLTAAVLHGGLDLGKVVGPAIAGVVAQAVGLPTAFRVIPLALLAVYATLHVSARRARARRALGSSRTGSGSRI